MQELKHDEIRQVVRENYGTVAKSNDAGCGSGCGCSSGEAPTAEMISIALGYSEGDVTSVPEGANMGLGCGNPQAIASLKPGETVLDLGSGGGFDCFLSARAVGDDGHVIGVDMTPDMVSKARRNLEKTGAQNIEFRLGEIEHLPVADNSVDVIISNCVINLSPQKSKVYKEAFRVLKPGGRLAISDVVATAELPEQVLKDLTLYTGCVSGASSITENENMLADAGFNDIEIKPKDGSKELIKQWAPGRQIEDFVTSASIEAVKPLVN
ncbi:MAG: arsenite methyltransferase [bacterium]|nr:arsenite methyltransferase [bacterium]